MNLALSQPWCSIGSDGSALATEGPLRRGNPHPRSFGTFARVLGVYGRERGLLRLEDAVRKMSSLNAAKIGLRDRGLLRVDSYADITLFDEKRVIDRATYDEPFQYSEGIEYVVVNGQVVLDKGTHTGARSGRALRHESVASTGRVNFVEPPSHGPRPTTEPAMKRLIRSASMNESNGGHRPGCAFLDSATCR
jgi:N-acyl-D-aspartate/D-glutamate deacylase